MSWKVHVLKQDVCFWLAVAESRRLLREIKAGQIQECKLLVNPQPACKTGWNVKVNTTNSGQYTTGAQSILFVVNFSSWNWISCYWSRKATFYMFSSCNFSGTKQHYAKQPSVFGLGLFRLSSCDLDTCIRIHLSTITQIMVPIQASMQASGVSSMPAVHNYLCIYCVTLWFSFQLVWYLACIPIFQSKASIWGMEFRTLDSQSTTTLWHLRDLKRCPMGLLTASSFSTYLMPIQLQKPCQRPQTSRLHPWRLLRVSRPFCLWHTKRSNHISQIHACESAIAVCYLAVLEK